MEDPCLLWFVLTFAKQGKRVLPYAITFDVVPRDDQFSPNGEQALFFGVPPTSKILGGWTSINVPYYLSDTLEEMQTRIGQLFKMMNLSPQDAAIASADFFRHVKHQTGLTFTAMRPMERCIPGGLRKEIN